MHCAQEGANTGFDGQGTTKNITLTPFLFDRSRDRKHNTSELQTVLTETKRMAGCLLIPNWSSQAQKSASSPWLSHDCAEVTLLPFPLAFRSPPSSFVSRLNHWSMPPAMSCTQSDRCLQVSTEASFLSDLSPDSIGRAKNDLHAKLLDPNVTSTPGLLRERLQTQNRHFRSILANISR